LPGAASSGNDVSWATAISAVPLRRPTNRSSPAAG
jgi:hypothetical protein